LLTKADFVACLVASRPALRNRQSLTTLKSRSHFPCNKSPRSGTAVLKNLETMMAEIRRNHSNGGIGCIASDNFVYIDLPSKISSYACLHKVQAL
jgi:hypothetical protein